MKRTQACAPQGETPVVEVPNTRAVSHTILGAISVYAVVKVNVRMPNLPSSTIVPVAVGKKRKLEDGKAKSKSRGTTTDHYMKFLRDTMDELDKFEYMHNCYLVMDNAPIHKKAIIEEYIQERNYRCVYLPPHSPELNSIE